MRQGLLAALFSILLCLGFAEIVFRTVLSEAKLRPKEWSDRPKFYYVPENATSLQDFAYPEEKGKGVFRIAVVGDSFAFAPYMQFDDTFAKRLERILNLQTKRKVEVINYGVPRYSTSHEVVVTKKALQQQADLVLLQICLNDPEIKPYTPTALTGAVVDRFGGIDYQEGLLAKWKTGAFVAKRLYNMNSKQKYVDYFHGLWKGKNTRKNFTKAFAEIKSLTTDAGVPLVGVVFPLVGLPIDESYPFEAIHLQIQELCRKKGVPCLDLLEAYRGMPIERLQVIVRKDFHPNEIGHRIAAEEIYSFLEESDLIPKEVTIPRKVTERIGIDLE